MLQASELYQLSQELSQKGPPQSELELRYLYQIYLEAGLLGWCFLIAVLLHDGFSVIRIINPSRMEELGPRGVANLRRGLDTLNQWAESGRCPGYKPFLTALKIHTTGIFAGIASQKTTTRPLNGGSDAAHSFPDVESANEPTLAGRMSGVHLREDAAIDSPAPESDTHLMGTPRASRATSESDQSVSASKKNASASSVSTTRSRSSTPVPTLTAPLGVDRSASPELAFTLMPSPDDVLMTSATSSRGFDVRDDDDDVNGNRRVITEDARAVFALNSSESECDDARN